MAHIPVVEDDAETAALMCAALQAEPHHVVRHAGHVVARRVIFEQVCGRYFEASDNPINVHIARLRRKLERPDRSAAIETIKREGYRSVMS